MIRWPCFYREDDTEMGLSSESLAKVNGASETLAGSVV